MWLIEDSRELTIRLVMNRNLAGAKWGPAGIARKDGSLGLVTAAVEWNLGPRPDSVDAVCTVHLKTLTSTGYPPNLQPWTQEILIVAAPCTGRLFVGPPRRKRIVAAADRYTRKFFLCPTCGARRRSLYLPGPSSRQWACRSCWRMGYRTQLEPQEVLIHPSTARWYQRSIRR